MRILGVYLVGLAWFLASGEPNPPFFPSSVYVFSPSNPGYTQSIIDKAFSTNGGTNPVFNGQFSSDHYAFMFLPGTHNINLNVGFYTSVHGLGLQPAETTIANIRVADGDPNYTGGALDNFWRSAENFQTGYTLWATSQACPLRRLLIRGNLDLYQYTGGCCAGYASGGYLSDTIVTGNINSGSQQQFLARNTNMGQWEGAVWNMVFVGNSGGVPGSHCGNVGGGPFTTVAATPVIAEKPYIAVRGSQFVLRIPKVETNKVGPTSNFDNVEEVDFSNVYVSNSTDSAATINAKLAQGIHVILTPGFYRLTESIVIDQDNMVLLGIGFPTLIATAGQPAIRVGNVDGVRVGGILLQAGTEQTSSLLVWGDLGYPGDAANPSFLYDAFARIGGPDKVPVQADVSLLINSGNTIIDNTWLWRADHTVNGEVYNGANPSLNGLVVNGDDVTVYGLAVEHHLNDQIVWNGERGRVYFYQSELPYDVNQGNYGDPGYCGYKVDDSVEDHQAWGVGVYTFFRDSSVVVESGIKCPTKPGISFVAPFTRFLNGLGSVTHVINDKGAAVNTQSPLAYVCN